MAYEQVTLVAHADWSINPAKRWVAIAALQPDESWLCSELSNVRELTSFFPKLKSLQYLPGCAMVGFDFPIGLPQAFAQKAGVSQFISTLPLFSTGRWADFYHPAEHPSQINLTRPFYPAKPGGSLRSHLEDALGIPFSKLYRLCEIATNNRRAACPLFWTMGGQQVGKAAISGWRDLLTPAVSNPSLNLKVWPFSGTLDQIIQPGATVVAETYPAEFYSHLGLSFSSSSKKSKRCQADRQVYADHMITWASSNHINLNSAVMHEIQDGFGAGLDGEDRFDALVGLYGMINVIQGNHPSGEPLLPLISEVEGWIFGQEGSQVGSGGSRSI